MIISAIISEYNPFHNGHKYQIEQTRKNGATHIISIMSGNFTQRGTPSVASKHIKAEITLKNGCDLVIELPVCYSISSAEKFAFGSIFLANALGCVDLLSFGCENDDIDMLQKAAQISSSSEVIDLTKNNLKKGISFAAARCQAIELLHGKYFSQVLLKPNNILAIEYLKSLNLLRSTIKPLPILRKGSGHNSKFPSGKFASSSLLRDMLLNDQPSIKEFIPETAYKILKTAINSDLAPAKMSNCERAVLAKLRCMTANDFFKLPDVNEGLENKIYKAVHTSNSLNEIYSKVKSKRYTHLRIQRIVLSAFLDIQKDMLKHAPPYIKVLGFNNRGKEILHIAKQRAKIPIVTKTADINKLKDNQVAMDFFKTECRAYDLYNLMLPKVQNCGYEMTSKIIKV